MDVEQPTTVTISKRRWDRKLELAAWVVLGMLSMWDFWRHLFHQGRPAYFNILRAASEEPLPLYAGLTVITGPWLFDLIFGLPPMGSLWVRLRSFRLQISPQAQLQAETARISTLNPRESLALFAANTANIANQLYRRSGVYLLSGVAIAFFGLVVFYSGIALDSTTQAIQQERLAAELQQLLRGEAQALTDRSQMINQSLLLDLRSQLAALSANGQLTASVALMTKMADLLPRFGMLFFIEFIAFFFLRQYRAAMDEFRYFDAIRRSREESLVILQMFAENPVVASVSEITNVMNIYSGRDKLSRGETTERLEARRLDPDETLIFSKLIDIIAAARERAGKTKKD